MHKGLGRLVYLCYFEKTTITSNYESFYSRKFELSDSFEEKSEIIKNRTESSSGTKLSMSGYTLTKLAQHSFIQPNYLKTKILEKFYSRLYKLKQSKQYIEISISATVSKSSATKILSTNDIPNFIAVNVENTLDLFSNIELYYYIEEEPMAIGAITAISIDDRTYPLDIIAQENLPIGYKMVFLLFSDYFNGKVDAARETISILELEQVKRLFKHNIAKIIDEKLPQITQLNKERKQRLINQFPHLNGYFEIESIGYTSQEDLLKKAQEKFFREQREILRTPHLTDEQFKQSLELASRTLIEYILFRQNTINKLKTIDRKDKESIIHNLIVPKYERFDAANLKNDLYRNNIWVFDDKYMTYDIILSEKEMSEVIQVITNGEVSEKDDDRPDIAMFFSDNPYDEDKNKKIDVVIVELKKKGISSERNFDAETQLKKRAGKLMQYYKNKIQQIWFYGIVDFDDEFEKLVAGEYHQLFSKGKVYYKPTEVVTQISPRISFPMGIFLLDFDAMVDDADTRNSVFLNIIKSKFQN